MIGILTLHYGLNYGGVLQAYALQKTLQLSGYDCKIIDRIPSSFGNYKYLIKRMFIHPFTHPGFAYFRRHYLHYKTYPVFTSNQMQKLSRKFKTIIVGSDQVWRKGIFSVDGNYFLNFLSEANRTKGISYAASFGVDNWEYDIKETEEIKRCLAGFKAISVREESGVSLIREKCNLNSICVLDPTLLADSKIYDPLLRKSNLITGGKLVSYILDWNDYKKNVTKELTSKLGKEVFHILPHQRNRKGYLHGFIDQEPFVYDWLKAIKDSDFVITDSYHGTIFSIIFNKQFLVIGNRERGLTRFVSLLKKFNLTERILNETEPLRTEKLLEKNIRYDLVNRILSEERNNSMVFLRSNLE